MLERTRYLVCTSTWLFLCLYVMALFSPTHSGNSFIVIYIIIFSYYTPFKVFKQKAIFHLPSQFTIGGVN